jgi:hypothetical protein
MTKIIAAAMAKHNKMREGSSVPPVLSKLTADVIVVVAVETTGIVPWMKKQP